MSIVVYFGVGVAVGYLARGVIVKAFKVLLNNKGPGKIALPEMVDSPEPSKGEKPFSREELYSPRLRAELAAKREKQEKMNQPFLKLDQASIQSYLDELPTERKATSQSKSAVEKQPGGR